MPWSSDVLRVEACQLVLSKSWKTAQSSTLGPTQSEHRSLCGRAAGANYCLTQLLRSRVSEHLNDPGNQQGPPPPKPRQSLSGPLNRLNAILSLLHPLDRYRAPSAIGSAIGRPLSRPILHPNTGGSPQPHRSKPLGGLNRAIVVL